MSGTGDAGASRSAAHRHPAGRARFRPRVRCTVKRSRPSPRKRSPGSTAQRNGALTPRCVQVHPRCTKSARRKECHETTSSPPTRHAATGPAPGGRRSRRNDLRFTPRPVRGRTTRRVFRAAGRRAADGRPLDAAGRSSRWIRRTERRAEPRIRSRLQPPGRRTSPPPPATERTPAGPRAAAAAGRLRAAVQPGRRPARTPSP